MGQTYDGTRTGKIIEIDQEGRIWVDFPGNAQGQVLARFVSSISLPLLEMIAAEGKDVLLTFENNDPALPVIVGALHASIHEITETPPPLVLDVDSSGHVTLGGRQVDVKAEEQMVFRCGKASITLTRAGKVLIRGAYLLNRSSGVNRIKGGSVQIN